MRRRGTRTQKTIERDKAILEVIPDMFFVFASNGTLLDYKPAKDQVPLLSPGDFIGKHIGEIFPPDISNKTTQSIEQALLTGKEQIFEYRLPLEEKIHHYEARMIPFGEKEVLAIVRDNTEWVRADETIKMGEERFRNLFGQTTDALFLHDSQGKILDLNRAACQSLGYTFEELLNSNISTFAEAFSPKRLKKLTGNLKAGEAATFEGTHRRKNGTSYPVSVRIIIFESGKEKLYLATTRDISEVKRTEKNLQESESRYRRLFENNPLPMYIYDMETLKILEINETFVSRYGYARDEILNITIKDIRPKEEFDRLVPHIRDLEPGMLYTGVWKHQRKDGTVIDVDITSTDFPYQNKRARLVLCNDITEKLRVEEELRESESRYRRLFEDNPMPMMIFEPDTLRFLAVNEAAEIHYGWTRHEFLSMTIKDIRPQEDVQAAVDYIHEMDQGLDKVGVWKHRKKDGSIIHVDITSHSLTYRGKSAQLALCHDVTERIMAEEEIRKNEERIKSSLKEKEILLKEVHHRVKNNLQVISGLLNLQARHITDPGAKEIYKESQNRVITMGLIHEELYQSKDLAQVDFAAYIQNLSSNLFASYGKEHSNVDLVIDAAHIEMIVDTAIPCGLIVNELISNSLKHAFPMEKEGEVRVNFHSMGDGVYQLSVADSGVGLPVGFDFRRSKSLGLQLVTVMTELLGGTIELNQDGGTTFTITFREYREAGTELH